MQKNITNCTSTVIESPIKKDSDIKRRSTHVRSLTYEESEQSSLDTPTKRPVRRAASIRSKTKYRESPEKIDISILTYLCSLYLLALLHQKGIFLI